MSGSRGDRINIFKSLFEQNHIQSLYEKADLLWRQKQYEQSIKMCNKLLSIQHNHSEAHNRLATNYKAIKDKKKAIKHYQWAIIYNKLNKTAYNNLGNMYSVDKKTWNRAQACYIKCIAIDSTYSGAHANYAALLRKLGQFDDAKYHYNCAIGFNPNNAWIHFNYANLMEEEFKDDKTAEVHYKKCLEIDDKYCAAYHNYAVLMHKRNELKKAKLYYKVALKLNNKCNLTQRNYALCLISMQKYNDAYHHLQLAFNLCIKKQKISTFDWNQKVDFMKDSVDLNNSEATEIILLLQHTLEQNEALCQDYEEGKKMLS